MKVLRAGALQNYNTQPTEKLIKSGFKQRLTNQEIPYVSPPPFDCECHVILHVNTQKLLPPQKIHATFHLYIILSFNYFLHPP